MKERAARWLRAGLIAWDAPAAESYRLLGSGASWPLTRGPDGLEVPESVPVAELLKGRVEVAAGDVSTGVQIACVLDDIYAAAADAVLGPLWADGRPSLAVWAPTARDVVLLLRGQRVAMERGSDGVWRVRGDASWRDAPYAFEVTVFAPDADAIVTNVVTDPYSVALTTNSRRSVLADLADPALAPAGWERLGKPPRAPFVDATIYELHVRDFSIGDVTVPAEHRGTYLAFTHADSDGMRHLRALAAAGMNTLHLLPCNDIATIEEDRAAQRDPGDLHGLAPDSEEQQRRVGEVRDADGFNWGYDPLHYSAPEGSYATDPEGTARTREFRAMVQAINAAGLRVVLDVVYNHTPVAGQDPRSILDRIVPGYYHRLSATGALETSTCCANTASEHRMMEKLMLDSLAIWAREYKVDGFRFDLMGHHTKANLLAAQRLLGPEIHLYGEGWSFGEVAGDARFVQASQANLAGTGIGTFSDRLRDAVRGGGPHDPDPRAQGFATGLFTDPNGAAVNGTRAQQRVRLAHYQQLIQLGLAGNLRGLAQVDYHGRPAGYAAEPGEAIAYVDAHDNETLFDALALKLPRRTAMADRVRMNTLALATTALAQGPCFWHAGADLLRSKSLDRNSYDSGDWFNRIDWSARESTWGAGLPPAWDNAQQWPLLRPLLADPSLAPRPEDLRAARDRARELLQIRFSSPLFRLRSAAEIRRHVAFGRGAPGVIVMVLGGEIVVVFNATPAATTRHVAARARRLHPVQAGGGDPVVREASYSGGAFTVPARTVAVFLP